MMLRPAADKALNALQVVEAGREIEAGGWLVENQRAGLVHQRARQDAAPLLAGRHRPERRSGEFRDTQFFERFASGIDLLPVNPVRKGAVYADARVKAGDDDFECRGCRRVALLQVLRYEPDLFAQLPDIPLVPPENAERIRRDRIQLAIDCLEQRGLAGAVRSEDRDTFVLLDGQIEVLEHASGAAPDCCVAYFDKWCFRLHEFSSRRDGIR